MGIISRIKGTRPPLVTIWNRYDYVAGLDVGRLRSINYVNVCKRAPFVGSKGVYGRAAEVVEDR